MNRQEGGGNSGEAAAVCDIHGVINLDALSTFFGQLTHQINQQNQTIFQMQTTMNSLLRIVDFEESMRKINLSLASLESKVAVAQESATSRIKEDKFTAGELATSNFYQIQKLQQIVSHCISRDEVEKQYRELMMIEETNKRIQKNLTVISQITDDLGASQTNLLDQFHHQETIIQRKLDRSELHQLQSLVTKVISYDEFRDKTEKMMLHFSQFEDKTNLKMNDHDHNLENIHRQLDSLHIEVNKCSSRRDLHIVAKELKALSDRVDLCATNVDLEAAKQRIMKLLQILEGVQMDLVGASKRMDCLQSDIEDRALIIDMNERLLISEFEKVMERVDDDLSARPQWPVTTNHQERIELLEHCQKSDSRRIAVAMKFVEWFTSRGENYDHNIKILDKHLRDLVTSDKTPRVHSYFIPGNRVQFTSEGVITPDLFRDQVLPPPLPGSAGDISGSFSNAQDRL